MTPRDPDDVTIPLILGPRGQPARTPRDTACPQCGAKAERRVLSSGFGQPHDVCGACGYDFEERTL
jgi:uncharacterized protein (DUF983 family)